MSKQQIRMAHAAAELKVSRQMLNLWVNDGEIKHELALGIRVLTRNNLERFKKSITYLHFIAKQKRNRANGKPKQSGGRKGKAGK